MKAWGGILLSLLFTSVLLGYIYFRDQSTRVTDANRSARLDRNIPKDAPEIRLEDSTEEAGIHFRHFDGNRSSTILEDMGPGIAWADIDNDGWQDLFLINYSVHPPGTTNLDHPPATCRLYRNRGDGTFEDVTVRSGLDLQLRGMGASWADIDNDGHVDLLVTGVDTIRLFRNNGNGTFTDITDESGIGNREGFWAGAVWGDMNRDGYVDLYVAGYIDYFEIPDAGELADLHEPPSINPSVFDPISNLLLMNQGDGTFRETAETLGVENGEGKSLQPVWVDINDDLYPELYVANDVTDNALFLNLRGERMPNISYPAKIADYRGSMGLAIGDWDNDLDLDLFITHWIAQENALYNNLGMNSSRGYPDFRDEADRFGLGQSSLDAVGWGTFFLDFDNDGRQDLFVANGHTNQHRDQPDQLIGQRDLLYWNRNNTEGFFEIGGSAGSYFTRREVSRGAAWADYNNDGWPDLYVMHHGGIGALLRNSTKRDHHWLQVSLTGTDSNHSAIGATLVLYSEIGPQKRVVGMQPSYLSQSSLVQHFGLGDHAGADSLDIVWPSGQRQRFRDLPSDEILIITEGETSWRTQSDAKRSFVKEHGHEAE